ncbi:MAG: putative transrane protein [Ramlibacter sp.]|jgi:O-antigen/teichoic acid export membrane protein|nr:putative transrane protein [Ramlibacter sp.]
MRAGRSELKVPGDMHNSATADNVKRLDRGGKFTQVLGQLTLFGLRAGSTVSKFLLAIYTARYLSLSDLGIYGLLVGGTNIVPALCGFGLSLWIVRRIVDLPMAQAVPMVASRSALSLVIHLVGQPLVFIGFMLAGQPLPLTLALLGGAILLMETLAAEISDVLIARRHIYLANWLGFLRQGFWPLPVMLLGLIVPQARTLAMLLFIWCGALALNLVILLYLLFQKGRWRHVRLHADMLVGALRASLLLYVRDVSSTVSAFADRFLISLFLGLELSGLYSLFWAIANVVHSLVIYGVIQVQTASLIVAAREPTGGAFRNLERRLQIESTSWALLFTGGVAVLTPALVTFLDRPLMLQYLPVFWLIVLATLVRIGADGYGFAIYALHRDRAVAWIAVGGAVSSALLNLVLMPAAGLWGSAIAYCLTSAALLAARFAATRSALSGPRLDS